MRVLGGHPVFFSPQPAGTPSRIIGLMPVDCTSGQDWKETEARFIKNEHVTPEDEAPVVSYQIPPTTPAQPLSQAAATRPTQPPGDAPSVQPSQQLVRASLPTGPVTQPKEVYFLVKTPWTYKAISVGKGDEGWLINYEPNIQPRQHVLFSRLPDAAINRPEILIPFSYLKVITMRHTPVVVLEDTPPNRARWTCEVLRPDDKTELLSLEESESKQPCSRNSRMVKLKRCPL